MAAMLDLDSTFTRPWLPPNAAVIAGIGFEWNRVPSPKFVHPCCTVTSLCTRVAQ
jgi:hypothetical protein